jgi:hypothetical protein
MGGALENRGADFKGRAASQHERYGVYERIHCAKLGPTAAKRDRKLVTLLDVIVADLEGAPA